MCREQTSHLLRGVRRGLGRLSDTGGVHFPVYATNSFCAPAFHTIHAWRTDARTIHAGKPIARKPIMVEQFRASAVRILSRLKHIP